MMKTSELIAELEKAKEYNGDQEVIIMVGGNRFQVIEVYTDDEKELYCEGYTH